jgi:hypothetical protein
MAFLCRIVYSRYSHSFLLSFLSLTMMLCISHMCNFIQKSIAVRDKFCNQIRVANLKGQSHEKVDELRVWGVSLGPN